MKFPAYDRYKVSGSEWCEPIPAHWSIEPLKYNSYVKGRIGWQNLRSEEFTDEGPFLITGMHFKDGSVDWDKCYHITEERYAIAPEIQVRLDDVLITKDGSIGKLAHLRELPGKASLNSHLLVIRPLRERYIPRYLYLLLSSLAFRFHIELHQSGTTFFGITQESVVKFGVILPPLPEQRAIVEFLDRETGRVDRLVAKKRELIERLKEKRTALVSFTVTRGLPPAAARTAGLPENPSLKPSGLDWLGNIPENWEVVPLGYLVRFNGGATPDKSNSAYWDGSIPWVSPKDMKVARIADSEDHVSPEALDNSALRLIPVDSVLIVVRGMILAHSFPVALTTAPVTINQDMKVVSSGKRVTPHFLSWSFTGFAKNFVSFTDASAHGTRKLETGTLTRFPFLLPPLREQAAIAEYLDSETAKLDALVAKVEAAIERLQEYRTAIITAAVTGKIDVRKAIV